MGELRLGRIVTRTKGRGTKRQGTIAIGINQKYVIIEQGMNMDTDKERCMDMNTGLSDS
jgi:ribosomal protein L14E/L6E/L27E